MDVLSAHVDAARRLLLGRDPPRPTAGGVGVMVGRTVDAVVFRVMQEIFIASHRRGVKQVGSVRGLAGTWDDLAEEALRDPSPYFPKPDPPTLSRRKERRRLKGGRVEDLAFRSDYYCGRPTAQRMLDQHPSNATAHVRHLGHDAPGHPGLIWAHGWGMGQYGIESRASHAMRLFELGLDVYLYTQPYHGARTPAGVRFAGTLHPSTQVTRTNEAFLQSAWEVRSLVALHHARAGAPCGVAGLSLGGYVAAMLAAVAPEIAFSIPLLPVADMPALLWSWGEGTRERAQAEEAGITFEEFCRSMAIHSPLAHPLAIDRKRVMLIGAHGDRIIPPEHTRALHRHWGEPELHWFPGSHIVHFGRSAYLKRVRAFLARLGLTR